METMPIRRAPLRRLRGALLAVLAGVPVLFSGCVVPAPQSDYGGPAGKDESVVILSVTRSGVTEFDLVFHLRGDGHDFRGVFTVRDGDGLDWKPHDGYEPVPEGKEAGRVVVLLLPPGDYRVESWSGESPFFGDPGNGYHVRSREFSLRFAAPAGKIRYVGNVHFDFPQEMDGYILNGRYRIRTGERGRRDLEVFRARYPRLAGRPVDTRLIESGVNGKELQFYIDNIQDHESTAPVN